MQRFSIVRLGTLLVASLLTARCWSRPRGFTTSDLRGGIMALDKNTAQYLARRDGLFVVIWSYLFHDENAGFGTESGSSMNGRLFHG